jgi:hypothetical protein
MTDKQKPAFPITAMTTDRGITLRDYFAAKAMQGIVSDPDLAMGCNKIAEWAYTQADAMLKARNN